MAPVAPGDDGDAVRVWTRQSLKTQRSTAEVAVVDDDQRGGLKTQRSTAEVAVADDDQRGGVEVPFLDGLFDSLLDPPLHMVFTADPPRRCAVTSRGDDMSTPWPRGFHSKNSSATSPP